ncbi:MAG: hypothetical protein PHU44_15335 [Syntrophales bacterium]|nr:hypothetical protein [Syntrophales bacterium]MDD5642788.1 hypothetical protein [Syntrophales bacterium]
MVHILLFTLGFFLLILLFTEDFWVFLRHLRQWLTVRPGRKFLAYPLAAAVLLAAAGCILFFLWSVVTTQFSYD